jgi:hypothetical protein
MRHALRSDSLCIRHKPLSNFLCIRVIVPSSHNYLNNPSHQLLYNLSSHILNPTRSKHFDLVMAELPSVFIENITYTHDELPSFFMLDQLLDRMAPILGLTGPSPQQVIGSLAIFPIEVLLIILENLAVTDVMRFRRCNRFAMQVVDTESPLRSCLQLAPIIVKGMMAIRTSAHITPQQLRAKLRQRDCDNILRKYFDEDINTNPEYEWARCGQMAQHLYLPTCMRLCLGCRKVQTGLDYEMAAVSGVVEPKVFAMAASFRSPPVTLMHGLNKFKVEAHQKLHDRTSILKVKKKFRRPLTL